MQFSKKLRDISRVLRVFFCRLCPSKTSVTYLPPPRSKNPLDRDELWREEETDPETPLSKRQK